MKVKILCLLFILTMILSGCTLFERQTTEEEPNVSEAERLDRVEMNLSAESSESLFTLGWSPELGLNPYLTRSTTNWTFLPLIYEGLFQLTPEFEAEPLLCTAAESSMDGRLWTLTLRRDAVFSNGAAMTAADVVYSLELAMRSELYGDRLSCIENIVQSGQYEISLSLSKAMGNLPRLLDIPVICSGSAEAPVGTGPYVLVQKESESYLEQVADWRGGELPIGRIYLYEVSNIDSVRDAFEFGRVDLVVSDLNNGGAVHFHSNYELWSQDTTILQFLSFNEESALFADTAVRAAVTYAIDRQTLITEQLNGYGVAATLPAHPRSSSYQLSLAEDYGYDPERLASAVTDAGLKGRRGTLLVNSDNDVNCSAAESIATSLREVGLEIEVITATGENYDSLLQLGGYDLAYCEVRLTADFDLSAFFGGNLSAYAIQHEKAAALCLAALENEGNFYDLHKLVMDEGLICPILFKSRAVMTDRGSVSGLVPAPINVFYGLESLTFRNGS